MPTGSRAVSSSRVMIGPLTGVSVFGSLRDAV